MEEHIFLVHPSVRLSPQWIDTIRKDVFQAEQQRQLSDAQLELCFKEKWFKALVPKCYGGLEWSVPEIVGFEESIGWADGSTGWVFTLCSGAGWFGGFLEENFAKKIFSQEKSCLAGSGAATGIAEIQNDGTYLVNGKWAFASGAQHASVFTANCQLFENGKPILENEKPKILSFCFLKEEVTIMDTWTEIGLVASAGHSFEVKKLAVSAERTFYLEDSGRKIDAPLYQFPFIQLAAATLGANFSGMCIHFMELFSELIKTKKGRNGEIIGEKEAVLNLYKENTQKLNAARNDLFASVEQVWQYLSLKKELPENTNNIFIAAQALAQTCRDIVNSLYPFCGLSVLRADTPISQVWRDFQTGSQHALFCPA